MTSFQSHETGELAPRPSLGLFLHLQNEGPGLNGALSVPTILDIKYSHSSLRQVIPEQG